MSKKRKPVNKVKKTKKVSQEKLKLRNVVFSTSFRYNRKAKKRPWNISHKRSKFAQIEGILLRIN